MKSSTKRVFREVVLLFSLILLCALLLILSTRLLYGRKATVKTQEITVRLEDIPKEQLSTLKVGDRVLDRTRRTLLGQITHISSSPHYYERAASSDVVLVEKKGYLDVSLRIKIDTENRRNLDTGIFYIGATLTISTHALAADGRITALSRTARNGR